MPALLCERGRGPPASVGGGWVGAAGQQPRDGPRVPGYGGVVQWETLARVQVPTIFIAGAEDPLFPSETLASFVPNFPDARIEVVRDAGHSPYFEQPDVFNRILEGHIQSAM